MRGRARLVRRPRLVLCLCVLALAGCPADAADEDTPILEFRTSGLRVVSATDTIALRVELAATAEERAVGLMERRTLAEDAGMLFLYADAQPATAAFWMFRTRIPLDIAYLDSAGTIRAIRPMVPCTSTLAQGCPTYPAGVPFQAALEMNDGWFSRHGIAVGDRVLLEDVRGAAAGER